MAPENKTPTGFEMFSDAIKALTGLANTYIGYENYRLGKESFNFNKNLANTNLSNQAKLNNYNLTNRTDIGLAIGSYTPEQAANYKKSMEKYYIPETKL